MAKINRICANPNCDNEFSVYPSVVKKGYGSYCSRECVNSDPIRNKKISNTLKDYFRKNPDKIQNKGMKFPFKSRPKTHRRVTIICQNPNCGRFFITHRSTAHRKFCSMKCRDEFYRESDFHKGENNPMYSVPAPYGSGWGEHSIARAGHIVRSTWERAIADWLYLNEISYDYENERFDLKEGITFVPDFYLSKLDLWIEVKGYWTKEARMKVESFKELYPNKKLLIIDKENFSSFEEVILGCV